MNESGYSSGSPAQGGNFAGPVLNVGMTFGQILDRTYRLLRSNFRLFAGIAAVPSIAIIVFAATMAGIILIHIGPMLKTKTPAPDPHFYYLFSILMAVTYLIFPAIFALYMPAASYAATEADRGVAVTFRAAYQAAWSRYGRYLWLMVLGALFVVVPVAVIAALIGVVMFFAFHAGGTGSAGAAPFLLIPLLALLYIGFFVYSILIMLRFALAYPACVEEGIAAWAALKRSAVLTRGAKGRIFLVLLITYAATYAVSLVLVLALGIVVAIGAIIAIAAHVSPGTPAFFVLIGLGGLGYLITISVTTLLSYSAYTTVLAVVYHDQRLRKEGAVTALPAAGGPA